jgi:hypothetical protein
MKLTPENQDYPDSRDPIEWVEGVDPRMDALIKARKAKLAEKSDATKSDATEKPD